MAAQRFSIIQGDSGPRWAFGFKSGSVSGYQCFVQIQGNPSRRQVTDIENDRFVVMLLPSETAALAPGAYSVGVEIRKDSVNYVRETHLAITIEPQIVLPPA